MYLQATSFFKEFKPEIGKYMSLCHLIRYGCN